MIQYGSAEMLNENKDNDFEEYKQQLQKKLDDNITTPSISHALSGGYNSKLGSPIDTALLE